MKSWRTVSYPGSVTRYKRVRTKRLCGGRYRVPKGRDIGDSRPRSLAEWSVSRYDEAILSFLVSSMNSHSKIVPRTLCFSITSKPKSIEIP
jgi:hypothetical protein